MKSQSFQVVYELRISVDTEGVSVRRFKYPAKLTGVQYIPIQVTEEMEKEGFIYKLPKRIKPSELLKPVRMFMWDEVNRIGYEIFFTEGQDDEARKLLKNHVDTVVRTMKASMDKTYESWTTKRERPPRK